MDITIKEQKLKDAINLSYQIPEFESPYRLEEYERRLVGVTHYILTAHINDKPVGFKIGYERNKDGSFYSWMGGVLPEFRRYGIAKTLADKQENWARKNGYTSIILKTRKKHTSMLKLCENRGFHVIKIVRKEPDEETQIILKKWLE